MFPASMPRWCKVKTRGPDTTQLTSVILVPGSNLCPKYPICDLCGESQYRDTQRKDCKKRKLAWGSIIYRWPHLMGPYINSDVSSAVSSPPPPNFFCMVLVGLLHDNISFLNEFPQCNPHSYPVVVGSHPYSPTDYSCTIL